MQAIMQRSVLGCRTSARYPALTLRLQNPTKMARPRRSVLARAEDNADLDRQLQEDLERLRLRQQREQEAAFQRGVFNPVSIRPPGSNASANGKDGGSGMKETVDKALIANFFFVLFAGVWLLVGLGVKFASESEVLLTPWLALWPFVFQPAIGVLMLGTIVQGTQSWARDKYGSGDDKKQ